MNTPGFRVMLALLSLLVCAHSEGLGRPEDEVLNPPAALASKLSIIATGMKRKEAEEILGDDWIWIMGDNWTTGHHAQYVSKKFPKLSILIWYGWTEDGYVGTRRYRNAGPEALILDKPAVVRLPIPWPNFPESKADELQ